MAFVGCNGIGETPLELRVTKESKYNIISHTYSTILTIQSLNDKEWTFKNLIVNRGNINCADANEGFGGKTILNYYVESQFGTTEDNIGIWWNSKNGLYYNNKGVDTKLTDNEIKKYGKKIKYGENLEFRCNVDLDSIVEVTVISNEGGSATFGW